MSQVVYTTAGPIATLGLLLTIVSPFLLLAGTLLGAETIIAAGLMVFLCAFVLAPISDTVEQ